VLLAWAYHAAHGFGPMLSTPSAFAPGQPKAGKFWLFFIPGLTANVGFWATLALNIPDFSRYAYSQRDQIVGQIVGLPTTMALYSFIGAAVTSATIVIYGSAIWNPVDLLTKFRNPVALVLAMLAAGSLPWFIPSLLHQVYVDPASVAAFAARADTPFGSIGSLLMLGGAWNAQTVPEAYGGPWSALWLAAVIVALAAYLLLARSQHRWPGLGVAAAAGLAIAALGVTAPGRDLLRSLIAAWPGFAVLRDAQQFIAPLALLESVGFGLAVTRALNPGPFGRNRLIPGRAILADPAGTALWRPARADTAGTLLGVLALLVPVLLLPGLAWGAAGRLRTAWYPATWLSAAQTLDASPAPGSVLLLPWATYRTPPWNHGEVVLDPWTRLLSRPLIWNDGTQVGPVALTPDDPRARNLDRVIDGTGPLTATLRAAGVRFVLDDADGSRSEVAARLPGSVMIIDLPGLTVYQLPG